MRCFYDGWQEIEDTADSLIRQYLRGLRLDELLVLDDRVVLVPAPVAELLATVLSGLHHVAEAGARAPLLGKYLKTAAHQIQAVRDGLNAFMTGGATSDQPPTGISSRILTASARVKNRRSGQAAHGLPSTTNRLYFHDDARTNIVALTDSRGNVVERYTYDPYGRPSIFDRAGASLASSTVGNKMLFAGRRYDPETGFYYIRHRYLHPVLGRFLTRDPYGLGGDIGNLGNAYTFAGNNPINSLDPLGLRFIDCNCRDEGGPSTESFGGPDPTATYTITHTCDKCWVDDAGGNSLSTSGAIDRPTGPENRPDPETESEKQKQADCQECWTQWVDATHSATTSTFREFVAATTAGVLQGCRAGWKDKTGLFMKGTAVWGCIGGAITTGLAAEILGMQVAEIHKHNLWDTADINYRACKRKYKCPL
jgi:RHS repeat-associated protein